MTVFVQIIVKGGENPLFEFDRVGDALDFISLCLSNGQTAMVTSVKEEDEDE